MLLPTFRIMDNSKLPENKCVLTLFGTDVWSKDYIEIAETSQTDVINNVSNVITSRLSEFINRHMVKLLVENVKLGIPFIVDVAV